MADEDRVGITPKSWTEELHRGVMHLGKRWYVVSGHILEGGRADECVSTARSTMRWQRARP